MDLEIREALEKLELEKDMLLGEEPKVEEHFAEEVSVDGEEWVEKPDTETSINKELLEREQQLM